MTAQAVEPERVPLVRDHAGRLGVPRTRISLDVIVAAFKRGKTPEAVRDAYESVSWADACANLACYLRRCADVEAYFAEQVRADAESQTRNEIEYPLSDSLLRPRIGRRLRCRRHRSAAEVCGGRRHLSQ